MIVLLDTSTPECQLTFVPELSADHAEWHEYTWQSDRELAHHLLAFLHEKLHECHWSFEDVTAIGVMRGPGSFTGLRIGLTVMNTIARDRNIPIVGTSGDKWRDTALQRLKNSENDQLVMPEYGADARITTPRK